MKKIKFYLAVILFIFAGLCLQAENNVTLFGNKDSEKIQFAVSELQNALTGRGLKSVILPLEKTNQLKGDEYNIVLLNVSENAGLQLLNKAEVDHISEIKNEGFIIHKSGENAKTVWVLGNDDAGLMYGGLEVAEIIRVRGIDYIENQLQNPYMKVRGTKFNIPLDVRTPTYTEPSDAAQNNIVEMWNFEFWKEYIDNLARYRYNLISLWNLHPFPSLVKVPEYPEVALNDVRKTTGKWRENLSLSAWGFDDPEIVNNYEVIREMTIDEKIEFWRKVMAYGKQRNVNFYVVTWNIFVHGTEGKYGITDRLENPITTDYFRKSIKEMVLTYPDLAGIGLTTGENMYEYSTEEKEEWAFATYGQGVLDALKEQPDRKFDFIHRQHQATASEITDYFKPITENENVNFLFSFKYAEAHVYSTVNQQFHEAFVRDIQSEDRKTLWTLRNDDVYYFRWGAPDFVREFIKNIPYDVSEGYYYGSDQYVWGREFLTKTDSEIRDIEIVKHWYQWMIWGRLGYNPDMSNDRFVDIIQARFPSVNGREMFEAWQSASMIYPLVTGFHWLKYDFMWYIEGGKSQPFMSNTPSGYHDVNDFINIETHPGSGNLSIPEYLKGFISDEEFEKTTPLQVAEAILSHAELALNWGERQSLNTSEELRFTVEDIKSVAWLGKYYAHKILAATYLAIFRETDQPEWHAKAIEELNLSASYWRHYASIALSNHHNPLWTNRVGTVDWKEAYRYFLYEITANNGTISVPSMEPTPGGILLGAEDVVGPATLQTRVEGYSGKGYVSFVHGQRSPNIEWKYNAPEAGRYILEFRYTFRHEEIYASYLEVNGEMMGEIDFWMTGSPNTWVWERVTVDLEKGENSIRILPDRFVLIDNLNVIRIKH